ncbi:flagellar hook-length control protein FliK [Kiloniella sp. EL199]|uniref:flagellar hook-length control protein FliK n=1 Tax=Kiloniella sp. EL199 TaxID=2107581 RepID=UPI0013C455E4|nr:flagellar hook-length control protein FliK [Kiloniella sp. EL199]
MNNYNIDITRTASQQSTAKSKPTASNTSQVFAEYLNSVGSGGKSAPANPSLTRDTSLLGKIFNKTPWPDEREISFSTPKEKFEPPRVDDKETSTKSTNSTKDEETRVSKEVTSEQKDSEASSKGKDTPTETSSDARNSDDTREHKEAGARETPEENNPEVAAVVVEPTTQQTAPQSTAQLKQPTATPSANQNGAPIAMQQSAKPENIDPGTNKAGVANIKVTQADVTSRPINNLTASTSVNAQSSQDINAASANASAQDKAKGLATASAAQSVNGKTTTPGQVAQAVLANNPSQNGNNANGQSQNSNNMMKLDLGQATNSKAQVQTAGVNFADTLAATSRTSKPTPTAPMQSTLRSMNVTPADQLSIHIKKAIGDNKDSISIKLHPSELGRVDVKLEIVDGNTMKAMITAERPDTLDMLQRDSRMLEKALQEAGLKTDGQSLSFSLKQDGSEQGAKSDQGSELAGSDSSLSKEDDEVAEATETVKQSSHDGDLDISI